MLSRLCKATTGTVGNGRIGYGMGSAASGAVELFNFPIRRSKNRSQNHHVVGRVVHILQS